MVNFYNKQLSKFWLCTLALFIISSQIGFSQEDDIQLRNVPIKICNFEDGGKGDLESPCAAGSLWGTFTNEASTEIEVLIAAYAVNIPNASKDEENAFPEDYPRPFLRYEYSPGEFKYTDELDNWTIRDQYTTIEGKEVIFYQAEKVVKILLPDNAKCKFDSETMVFPMDLSLSTFSDERNDWEEYPVLSYGGADDIFSCEVFHNTQHLCYPDREPMNVTAVNICVPCPKKILEANTLSSVVIDKNHQLKILNNPFNGILEYQLFSKKESDFAVSLHSFDGQNVANTNIKTSIGQNDFQISSDNFRSGIYYLSIVGEGTKTVQKVMCVK